MTEVHLIAAHDEARVMGRGERLPWHLPADLRFFRERTLGETVLFGRRTYEGLGRPLPGREVFVLTRDLSWRRPGVTVVHSLEEARERCSTARLFVAGGAEVYRQALPLVQEALISLVPGVHEGEVLFPPLPPSYQEVEVLPREGFTVHRYLNILNTLGTPHD